MLLTSRHLDSASKLLRDRIPSGNFLQTTKKSDAGRIKPVCSPVQAFSDSRPVRWKVSCLKNDKGILDWRSAWMRALLKSSHFLVFLLASRLLLLSQLATPSRQVSRGQRTTGCNHHHHLHISWCSNNYYRGKKKRREETKGVGKKRSFIPSRWNVLETIVANSKTATRHLVIRPAFMSFPFILVMVWILSNAWSQMGTRVSKDHRNDEDHDDVILPENHVARPSATTQAVTQSSSLNQTSLNIISNLNHVTTAPVAHISSCNTSSSTPGAAATRQLPPTPVANSSTQVVSGTSSGSVSKRNKSAIITSHETAIPNDLPEGWEERRHATSGRFYYVNHATRTTQWVKPMRAVPVSNNNVSRQVSTGDQNNHVNPADTTNHVPTASSNVSNLPINNNHLTPALSGSNNNVSGSPSRGTPTRNHDNNGSTRPPEILQKNLTPVGPAVERSSRRTSRNAQNYHHRHNSNPDSNNSSSQNNHSQAHRSNRNQAPQNTSQNNGSSRSNMPLPPIPTFSGGSSRNTHGLPPGFEMKTTAQGQVVFYKVSDGTSTWYDPRVPRELIEKDLNLDELIGPLPSGWEVRKTPGLDSRCYFVDHRNKTTQFTDPRLVANHVILQNILRSKSSSSNPPTNNNGLVTGVKKPKSSSEMISIEALNQRIPSSVSDRKGLLQKMSNLRQELASLQPATGHCRVEVSREDIFEESYRAVMKMRYKDMRKRLVVKFKGEEGLDYGGVAREWLYLLSHAMLNPQYGLFQYSPENMYTLQINPDSGVNPVSHLLVSSSIFLTVYP